MEEVLKYAAYVVTAMIGWFVNIIWNAQKTLRMDMDALRLHLVETYTKKDDFKEVMHIFEDRLKETTIPLYKKLDRIEDILLNKTKGE